MGAIPYSRLHQLYRAADIYVTPAYAETFAHPLVEAMASGLPIVASDIPVHREISKNALLFDRFSPSDLAAKVLKVTSSPELAQQLVREGTLNFSVFSWSDHLNKIVALARTLVD
jgi:glycosyltransferase involved in cell wall biosynthesis